MRYFTWDVVFAVQGGEGTTPETFIPSGYLTSDIEYAPRKILGYGDDLVDVKDGQYWNLVEITLEQAWAIINQVSTEATLDAEGKFQIPIPEDLWK